MATMFCTTCGAQLLPDAAFCQKCGKGVSESLVQPNAATSSYHTIREQLDSASNYQKAVDHLEFLGYTITPFPLSAEEQKNLPRAERCTITHASKIGFILEYRPGYGYFLLAWSSISSYAKTHQQEFLAIVNQMNIMSSSVTSFNTMSDRLYIQAWHPDNYSKATFGFFIAEIEADMQRAYADTPNSAKFF